MPGAWETADMLLAMAGDGDAAAALAHAFAEDCVKQRRPREAAFWREVATAVLWLANPQPLIAPETAGQGEDAPRQRRARENPRGATIHRLQFAERLPRERRRLSHIKRKLRAILERHRIESPAKKPNGDG